jgi:hypothetical protein
LGDTEPWAHYSSKKGERKIEEIEEIEKYMLSRKECRDKVNGENLLVTNEGTKRNELI